MADVAFSTPSPTARDLSDPLTGMPADLVALDRVGESLARAFCGVPAPRLPAGNITRVGLETTNSCLQYAEPVA
jgi:hypothetical protein